MNLIIGTEGQEVKMLWNHTRNIIQTDVIVSIEDVYKNTPYNDKEITVRINKGKIDNTTMTSEGYPDFIPGEEVILFLSDDDGDLASPNENYYVLTGLIQGKFSIKENSGLEKTFTNKVETHSLIDKDVLELKTAKSEIKATLDELKKNPLPKLTKEEIRENNKKVFGE